jgi:hypothetical protein
MKVRVQQNIEIDDLQRLALAKRLHGPAAKMRDATREEIQDFAWEHGTKWADYLAGPKPVPDSTEERVVATISGGGDDLLGMGDLSEYGSAEEVAEVVDDLLGAGPADEDPMSLL